MSTIKRTIEDKQEAVKVGLGELLTTETFHTYVTKSYDEVVKRQPLNLPPLSFSTVGLWFTVPDQIREDIESTRA